MSGPGLPPALVAALEALLERRPRGALQASALRLSKAYRARRTTAEAIRDEIDALAYALTRMPATYAAAVAALSRLRDEQPHLRPRSLLDAGCGLGAAAYAARAIWPELETVTLLDRSPAFLALAGTLARESAALSAPCFVAGDLTRLPEDIAAHDLVIAGYALTELPEAAPAAVAEALFARASGALLLIEPGTPRDHARLSAARARLIAQGAVVLAPCPHNAPCPLPAPDWCHFSVRLPRSRAHRLLKGAQAPFEDEKFAYLAAARSGAPAQARIVGPPGAGKAGTALKLCGRHGIRETFVAKRDKPRFESIRKKGWGDPVTLPAEETG